METNRGQDGRGEEKGGNGMYYLVSSWILTSRQPAQAKLQALVYDIRPWRKVLESDARSVLHKVSSGREERVKVRQGGGWG